MYGTTQVVSISNRRLLHQPMATATPSPSSSAQNSAGQSRHLSLRTVAVGYLLIEVALWTPKVAQFWIGLVAGAWILGTTILSRRSAEDLGLALKGALESAWVVAAALVAGAVLILSGWLLGWLHGLMGPVAASTHVLAYTLWAFQQEFILQCFLFLNLLPVLGTRRAIFVNGILFAAAHLPNPVLTVATLVSGLCFTAAFARYRNVYTLAVAHAVLGLALAVSLPADLHRNMRVGLGYLSYRPRTSTQNAVPLTPNPPKLLH
jgi:Type II CAAX prenyl endopeptidase Rce1-like